MYCIYDTGISFLRETTDSNVYKVSEVSPRQGEETDEVFITLAGNRINQSLRIGRGYW